MTALDGDRNTSTALNESIREHANVDLPVCMIVNEEEVECLTKFVIRAKLQKLRHLVIQRAIRPNYLESIFPDIIRLFEPQLVQYNQGIDWKISCYLEVMPGGVPCTNPSIEMLDLCRPLLDSCNRLFLLWYRQQHVECKNFEVRRIMTFITRYTAAPGEQALLKHVDGAGKVDGSVVGEFLLAFTENIIDKIIYRLLRC